MNVKVHVHTAKSTAEFRLNMATFSRGLQLVNGIFRIFVP
jgi:hypothetical protein